MVLCESSRFKLKYLLDEVVVLLYIVMLIKVVVKPGLILRNKWQIVPESIIDELLILVGEIVSWYINYLFYKN